MVDDCVGDGVKVRSVFRPEVEELLGELGRNEDVAGADDTVSADVGTLDKFEDDEGAEVDVAGTMVVFDAVDDWPSDTVLLTEPDELAVAASGMKLDAGLAVLLLYSVVLLDAAYELLDETCLFRTPGILWRATQSSPMQSAMSRWGLLRLSKCITASLA